MSIIWLSYGRRKKWALSSETTQCITAISVISECDYSSYCFMYCVYFAFSFILCAASCVINDDDDDDDDDDDHDDDDDNNRCVSVQDTHVITKVSHLVR